MLVRSLVPVIQPYGRLLRRRDCPMSLTRAKANVARTAHVTAWARSLGRLTAGDVANGDYLADRALLPLQAALIRVPRLSR